MICGIVTDMFPECGLLTNLAVDPQLHVQLMASPISSGVTIHGPSGQKLSIALQKENTPERISRRWMSRAVMSLKIR